MARRVMNRAIHSYTPSGKEFAVLTMTSTVSAVMS
jgi:hypothetical protein